MCRYFRSPFSWPLIWVALLVWLPLFVTAASRHHHDEDASSSSLLFLRKTSSKIHQQRQQRQQHTAKLVTPDPTTTQTFRVTDWGVVGNGLHDDTDAMRFLLSTSCDQLLVARNLTTNCPCHHKHIIIPAHAIVKTLPLNLSSHTTLQIDGTLLASPSSNHWPIIPANPLYGDSEDRGAGGGWLIPQYQSFLYAQDATHIRMTGTGVVDGNGPYWWNLFLNRSLTEAGRPNLIQTVNCSVVEMDSVTMKDAGFWTVHPMLSKDIAMHHLKIRAPLYAPNIDGIDPDACQNVLIEYNDVACGDDHIAIKAGVCGVDKSGYRNSCMDPAWRSPADAGAYMTRNITIRHNVFGTGMGVAIGSESSGSIRDVYVYNNTIGACQQGDKDKYHSCGWGYALHIKTTISRSGVIDNIVFDNNTIYNNTGFILMETNY